MQILAGVASSKTWVYHKLYATLHGLANAHSGNDLAISTSTAKGLHR